MERVGQGRRTIVGAMLRQWREQVAGRSQRSAARQLGVPPSLWSGWESGREALGHDRVGDLDRLFEAEGTLTSLLEAASTPEAFPARTAWWFNVQGPSQPWWIWIRPEPSIEGTSAMVTLRWGPSYIPPLAVPPEGIVITTPVSMPNPPLSVTFVQGAGWADMGPGELPAALGLVTFDGVALMRSPTPDFGTYVAMDGVRRLLGMSVAWPQALRGLLGDTPFLGDVLAVREAPNTSEDVSESAGEPAPPASGEDFARARIGRGHSRAEAARAVTALQPGHPVSEHQVQRLEAGREPRPILLRSRLDSTYRADGHLACELVPVARLEDDRDGPCFEVRLPRWWIGPVWFRVARAEEGLVPVRIEWGRWAKDVLMRSDQAVSARRPSVDYPDPRVGLPVGATLTAGVGRAEGAADINKNWLTIDSRATAWLLAFTARNYLEAFGKTAAQAAGMVQEQRHGDVAAQGEAAEAETA